MADEGLEKEHEPSGKRLGQLKEQGQTLRSKDFSGGVIVITCAIALMFLQGSFGRALEGNFIIAYSNIKNVISDDALIYKVFAILALKALILLLPIMVIAIVATLAGPAMYGGWNFTLEPIAFNLNKMNVVNNLANMFSLRIFADMGRSLLKFLILMGAVVVFSYIRFEDMIHLMRLPTTRGIIAIYFMVRSYILYIFLALIVVVALDAYYHYRVFMNKNKMSTQELKDEAKESEGNPEVKGKIRAKQMSFLRQRLKQTVPLANVVVTNPTHYAVALRYDTTKDHAPKVVAMGKDLIAAHIRQIAISHAVPLYQAPVLARAIYHTSKVGKEIHPELYMAVAIVLSYVYQLKNFQQGIGDAPYKTTDLKVPEAFIYKD